MILKNLRVFLALLFCLSVPYSMAFLSPELIAHYHYNYLGKNVVTVFSDEARSSGGTGFYIKTDTGKVFLVTNRHICWSEDENDPRGLFVVDELGKSEWRKIIKMDPKNDLCLLDAGKMKEGLRLSNSYLRVSYAIGHPDLLPLTVTQGEITGIQNKVIPLDMPPSKCIFRNTFVYPKEPKADEPPMCFMQQVSFIVNMPIRGGASGSPVVDVFGKVTGVVYATDGDHTGYIVPALMLKTLIQPLI